ncbi:MAG: hypothetical protein ABII79_07705 [bacterium]
MLKMRGVLAGVLVASTVGILLSGCPPSMEVLRHDLLLRNNSNIKLITLLNLRYPDSSLHQAMVGIYLNPKDENWVGSDFNLKQQMGLTLMVYDYNYFVSRHERGQRPSAYLEEDKMLKRWVLSKKQLDSLKWVITYP